MPRYSYSARVKAALCDLGKTQKELAEAIGYSPQYISQVIANRTPGPGVRRSIDATLDRWRKEAAHAR